MRNLHRIAACRSALHGDFPYLQALRAAGAEVDPLAVVRPTRHGAVGVERGDALWLAAKNGNSVNRRIFRGPGIEGEILPVWRPARRTRQWSSKRRQLPRVCSRCIAHPNFVVARTVRTESDFRAVG